MSLAVLVNIALVAAAFAVAFAIEGRVHSDARRRSLPVALQLLVAGVAMSPLFFTDAEWLAVGVVDESVVAVALSFSLWILLPVVLSRVVETDPQRSRGACT